MTSRQFDPVFSAALRTELEALAEAPEETAAPARHLLPSLRRPQVWISLVTAVVLVAATIGVLHLTAPVEPAGASRIVDPLSSVTNPSNAGYVAREVNVLLHISAAGPGSDDFSVPAGVTSVRIYLNCAPSGHSAVDIDGQGRLSGDCSRDSGSSFDIPITAGTHDVAVTVEKGTDYTLLLMASPAPTVSTGALLDPLTQVRDLRNPDALVGDTTPLIRAGGAPGDTFTRFTVPAGVTHARAYLVCARTSAAATMRIGVHIVSGCMNSIAHWFDFSNPKGSVPVTVTAPVAWSLLVVPAPSGAKDSPANTTLSYPKSPGTLLGEARGSGAAATGTYRTSARSILFTVTCRGTGWLELASGEGGTNTRGTACSKLEPSTIGLGGETETSLQTWSVIPHGDISWTFRISTAD